MGGSLEALEGREWALNPRSSAGALLSVGLGQKLLNPEAMPLLADQPRLRWGGSEG